MINDRPVLKSVHIENFRCFEALDINPLARINLIAGKNSVGKTAALEALFLLVGAENLGLILKLSQFRGIQDLRGDLRSVLELLWTPLFYQLDVHKAIRVKAQLTSGDVQEIELNLVPATSQTLGLNGNDDADMLLRANLSVGQVLTLRFVGAYGRVNEFEMKFLDGDLKIVPVPSDPPFPGYFLSARRSPSQEEAANLLGRLIKSKLVDELDLLNVLRVVEPRLLDVDVIPSAGTSMMYGDIGLEQMLPLSLMGDGLIRVISILLRIANAPGGVVLIDEIENGLHHSILRDFWRAVERAATVFDTQIIATTHSYECIREAHLALSQGNARQSLLHRLDYVDGRVEAITYDQEALDAALKVEFEVR